MTSPAWRTRRGKIQDKLPGRGFDSEAEFGKKTKYIKPMVLNFSPSDYTPILFPFQDTMRCCVLTLGKSANKAYATRQQQFKLSEL